MRGAPVKLAESQSFRPALDLLVTQERLRAVALTTGFALESLPRGVIAGFDLGTLYLAELPAPNAEEARLLFERRQIRDVKRRTPDPNVVVLSGTNEGIPVGLLTIDDRVAIYGVGDPTLWRVAEAYALKKLRAKTAFAGAALAGQDLESRDAPLAAHLPGPFEERWHRAAGGLLAVSTSLTATLTPTGPHRAVLELSLHGDFTDSNAAERLRSTYMSVAGSSTGSLLGLSAALDARATLNATGDRVSLTVPLPLTDIARGARAATAADISEILGLANPRAEPLTPTSTPDTRQKL